MGDYKNLIVWQRARALASRIDVETRAVRRGHAELADQLRRAALSIPTNLAEGSSRGRDGDFMRYVNIAIGSAAEAESLLIHARDVEALDPQLERAMEDELVIIRKMLFKLRAALNGKGRGPRRVPSDSEPSTEDQSQ